MQYGFLSLDEYYVSVWILNSGGANGGNIAVYYEAGTNFLMTSYWYDPCGCEYKCPTILSKSCLKEDDGTYNKSGQSCGTSCTTNSLSCGSAPTDCILKSKTGCKYGLYDLETLECKFYCPYSSCICPTLPLVSLPVSTLLSCTCIAGFKKISEDPQACMSVRCLEYHGVVCDTTESGYTSETHRRLLCV